jgi:hypothetical protein
LCRNPPHPMSFTTPPALPTAFTPQPYAIPSPIQQAQWSEARLGQECGLWLAATHPAAYRLFFHIPNGGLRTAVEGMSFKMQHAKAGVPDYFLACTNRIDLHSEVVDHGLFIELKTATGRVAPAQLAWHTALRQQGYRVEVVRSLQGFIDAVTEYLA